MPIPASMSTLPSDPVRTATFPPEPSSTILDQVDLTRPRASANASRGVSHPPLKGSELQEPVALAPTQRRTLINQASDRSGTPCKSGGHHADQARLRY